MSVTEEQLRASNEETRKHINTVRSFIDDVIGELKYRALVHDQSKLEEPEVGLFAEYTSKLKNCTYGSEQYLEFLKGLKPALDHHYAKNTHHPEHYPNGIDDMNLIDIIEMFCDWKAATMRHNDGNLLKSVEINTTRFKMTPQLASIFRNTAKHFDS